MASGQPDGKPRVDRRLARETRAARPHFLIGALLGVASAALTVAQAVLLAQVIAAVAMGHATLADERAALVALGAVLALRALVAGAFELSGRLAAARVLTELRRRLVQRLLVDRPGLEREERTGELVAAAVQGVDGLETYFAGYLPSLILALAVPVAVLAWVTPIDPLVALIFALTIPVLIAFMILIGVGAQSRTRARWQALTLLSSHFLDVVRGLETLRAHRRERAQVQIIDSVGERYRVETMGTLRLAFISSLVLELCAMLGTALAAATIGVQLTGGDLSLDAGLTVLFLAPELYGPLRAVGQQFHATADGLAAAGRLFSVLDQTDAVAAAGPLAGGAPSPAPLPPRHTPDPRDEPLRFERVRFTYPGSDRPALQEITLTLAPGEFVAVIGPSGAGKSTLAALALGLVHPDSGRVSCGGVDLCAVSPEAWRDRLAWVPQRTKLFADTLGANIALAVPRATAAEIRTAAVRAGLEELIASLPAGLQTRIGDGGRRLSAGEGQRVALARAFLTDASLVVLDEPTANLDPATAGVIGDGIERLAGERTVLLITHDARLAARAQRTVRLRDGAVLAPKPQTVVAV